MSFGMKLLKFVKSPVEVGLLTNFNSFIPMTYKKGLFLSLISPATLISVRLISLFIVNFRTKYFLVAVIQSLLLITALGVFSTKYFRLNHMFIPALKRFFSFAFHTLVNMVYKYAHNSTDYSHLLTHIYLFALSSVLRADCLTFFHSRTEFLLQ